MGYLSCNAESAISTCDPYNWDRKRRTKKNKPITSNTTKTNRPVRKIREFTYAELVTATNGFSADSFLGKGSHGTVYKASLDDGKLIAAVKKTHKNNNNNNFNTISPADNEIEILSRVQNPRLVNLLGFCADSKQRKLLVVEYMPHGSLHELLHGSSRPLGWTRRIRFALQVAKAVQSLHSSNPPVIHRDIKSSNVLIDRDGNARLGDFGLALRGNVEDVRVKCTPPAGTLGYLDPGYLSPGDLSTKSDVFSFGILLLEIISGRNAIDVNYSPPSIVDWAVPLIQRGDCAAICDNRVGSPVDPGVIRSLAVLAARCVRSTAEKRPGMAEVVEGLKLVRKRVQAPAIWNQLRRRVGRVAEGATVVGDGGSEEVVVARTSGGNNRPVRMGSRRNRKVSSVSSVEYGSEAISAWVGDRLVVRSRSIGSFREMNMGSFDFGRKDLAEEQTPAVGKLSKSRSMGLFHRTNLNALVHYNKYNRGYMFEWERESVNGVRGNDDDGGGGIASPRTTMLRLSEGVDEETSEKAIQEKPLFFLY